MRLKRIWNGNYFSTLHAHIISTSGADDFPVLLLVEVSLDPFESHWRKKFESLIKNTARIHFVSELICHIKLLTCCLCLEFPICFPLFFFSFLKKTQTFSWFNCCTVQHSQIYTQCCCGIHESIHGERAWDVSRACFSHHTSFCVQ